MQHWPKRGSLLFIGKADDQNNDPLSFSKQLLCQKDPDKLSLIEAGTHPDFLIIEPEGKSSSIKIDQIRELCEWSTAKPSIATQKIAIIKDAHAMNIQSANAFLKTLEEPNQFCLFILISDQAHRIIPTIRSRCFIVRHRTKDLFYGIKELEAHAEGNSIKQQVTEDLEALQSAQIEPVTLAQTWLKKEPERLLYWMVVRLCAMTYSKALLDAYPNYLFRDKAWWDLITKAWQVRRAIEDKMPYNLAMMIETLLIEFVQVSRQEIVNYG